MEFQQKKFFESMEQLDKLNDEYFTAYENRDTKEMDRIGRDLSCLGRVIKDLAHEAGRQQ